MIKYAGLFFIIFMGFSCATFDRPRSVTYPEPDAGIVSVQKSIHKKEPLPRIPPIVHPVKQHPEKPAVFIWLDAVSDKSRISGFNVPLPQVPKEVSLPVANIHVPPRVSSPVTKHRVSVAASSLPDKNITLYKRDKVVLTLAGAGWIFMGSIPQQGIVFQDKITSNNNDVFYFTAQTYSDFVLTFEKQRIAASKNEKQRILLHLKEKKDTTASTSSPVSKSEVKSAVKTLDELLKTGEYEQALQTYNKHDVLMNLLKEGVNSGKLSALIFFYNKLSGNSGLTAFLNDEKFLDLSIDAGKILVKHGLVKQGARLIEWCLPYNKEKSGNDALLFILGSVYQNDSSIRDEKRAVIYYKNLLDEYPASIYWDRAHKEYMFLKRRYIDVR